MAFLLEVLLYGSMLFLLFLLLLLGRQALLCYKVYKTFTSRGIPGPKPSLLIGNFWQMRARQDPNEILDQWIDKYGNVFGYFMGSQPFLVVNDVDIIQEIVVRRAKQFQNRLPMAIPIMPISRSVVVVESEEWRNQRRIISPAFSPSKLRQQFERMNDSVDVLLEVMAKRAETGTSFDIYECARALTLDVIAKCALAMEINCQRNPEDYFLTAVKGFFEMALNPVVEAAIMFPPLKHALAFVNNHLTAGQMTDFIVANTQKIIQLRRTETTKRTDLLQVLLDSTEENKHSSERAKFRMGDYEAMANAYVFLLAGYETTSTALGFTFYLLAKHQDVQERLYQEIRSRITDEQKPSFEDIMEMQYLDQVLNESMRIYPPITLFLTRMCEEECEIYGQTIPKGVAVQTPIWKIHHDPQHYPDPWKFDPDRFSPENRERIHPAAFQPFGIGPRNCIGMKFALQEAKLVLARVVKTFKLTMTDRTEDPPVLTCPTVISYPKNGVFVKVSTR